MSERETGIDGNGILEVGARLAIGRFVLGEIVERFAAQISLVRLDVVRAAGRRSIGRHLHRQRIRHVSGDFALEREHVTERVIDFLRPFAEAALPVGQIGRDPDRVARPLDRALQQICDTELPRDRFRVARLIAERGR